MAILSFQSANDLPLSWDRKAPHLFLKKDNLAILEEVNPCAQEYYEIGTGNDTSLFMTYRLSLNILTYSLMKLNIRVTMTGLPLSVSKCGYHISSGQEQEFFTFLAARKGWKIILNAPEDWKFAGWSQGKTLASCVLTNHWDSFEDYLQDMRSSYRYRIQKAQKKWTAVREVELTTPAQFDEKLYRLYLNVYERSEVKLEKQPMAFFKNFPATIIAFYDQEKPLGFIQLVAHETELIFLLGGFDYQLNFQYDIYWNMLLTIVKRGITGRFKTMEFGQTAEETKMKLGCILQTKYMYVHHSNPLLNKIVHWLIPCFSYQKPEFVFNVFKETSS
jgi:hypothetical protein